jgi:hypothetical protein
LNYQDRRDTDIQDFVPANGGSLRDRRTHTTREPVATFTAPQPWNLDELHQHAQVRAALRPGYREDGAPYPGGSRKDHRTAGHAAPHEETARMIRAAVRP